MKTYGNWNRPIWLIVAIAVVYLIYKLIKSERSLHQAGQSSEAPRIFRLKGTPRESWSLMDGRVEEFLKRPIEHPIPYLFIDASYSKVRTDSRYITKALLIVTAVRDVGYREMLGARTADGKDELFWTEFFDALKDRGLSGEKLVVSIGFMVAVGSDSLFKRICYNIYLEFILQPRRSFRTNKSYNSITKISINIIYLKLTTSFHRL